MYAEVDILLLFLLFSVGFLSSAFAAVVVSVLGFSFPLPSASA